MTAYRRKQALHEITDDERRRQVAEGVSRYHMRDCKNVEPRAWYTGGQLLTAVTFAFCAGVGCAVGLLILFSME